jgi:hypothetical protein
LLPKNKVKFNIHEDGRFDTNVAGKTIKESDYKQVLDYMLGEKEGLPKGFKFLLTRLGKEPIVKNFMKESKLKGENSKTSSSGTASKSEYTSSSYSSQSGEGKRRVHIIANAPAKLIKAAKTKGLIRNKFRPTLWAKL